MCVSRFHVICFLSTVLFADALVRQCFASASVPRAIFVEPEAPALYGPLASQQLVVMGVLPDRSCVDLTRHATFSVEGPAIVKMEANGVVFPLKDGITRVVAKVGPLKISVPLLVNGAADALPRDFLTLVEPVFSRYGCNNAKCHGSPGGQSGFKLSLFGYDPKADYVAVAEAENGRRINTADPDRSLILRKPTAQVNHGGKQRFTRDSETYRLIREWIASGANWSDHKDNFVVALKVSPTDLDLNVDRNAIDGDGRLEPSSRPAGGRVRQQLIVTAWKADGTLEDVTRKARYLSNNEAVAEVSPEGLLMLHGRGDVAVMARYLGKIGVARFTVIGGDPLPRNAFPPVRNVVDEKVFAKLARLRIPPAPIADDYTFLRRVYLDVTGQIPRRSDIDEYINDSRSDKRARLIDRLLDGSDYVEFWSMKWADWLRNNVFLTQPKGQETLNEWLVEKVRDNRPYDDMVRELLTATGRTYTLGPANYFRIASNPLDLATATSQLFAGVRLECARCHNHPFEKWTRDDYYSFAAFFTQVGGRRVEDPSDKNSQNYEIFDGNGGGLRNPGSGEIVAPRFLDGNHLDFRSGSRPLRQVLADWLTAKDNRYFARALVNRVWYQLFGRGIVEPVDDFRATNPPSNPELLDALAHQFADHGFDVKWLLRTILNSATYQLTGQMNDANRSDTRNFSRHYARRLSAQQLLDALCVATGFPEYMPGMAGVFRATQLPGPQVPSYFLEVFGRCTRVTLGEQPASGSMVQALELINGYTVNAKLDPPGSRLDRLLRSNRRDGEIITELYLATLCRKPNNDELNRAEMHVCDSPSRRAGFEDVLWALLNSKEFMHNM